LNIYKFNELYGAPESKLLLRKALSSAVDVGDGLIKDHYEQVITNTMVRLVPELSLPELKFDPTKFHKFTRMTALPAAGSAMGESSITPTKNSTSKRATTELKIMKRKGSVTGFLTAASKDFIDAPAAEFEAHVQSFGNDMRTYMMYGNAGADPYSWSGLDYFIQSNRKNLASGSAVPADLSLLDEIIDANTRLQGNQHRRTLEMSPELLSAFSRYWTNVRDVRSLPGTKDIEVPGGYRLESYRHVPIVETSATRPLAQMGTVTLSTATTGGTIPAATYYFRVAAITWDGEQGSSAASNSQVTTGSTSTVTLTFAAVANALYYKIYCSSTSGQEKLVKVVSAFTYDGNGSVTGVITSVVLTTNPTVADVVSVPVKLQNDIPLEFATGTYNMPTEYLILWDLDPFQGLGKLVYTNDSGSELGGMVTAEELAKIDDFYDFLLKSYPALIDAFEATSYVVRGIRTK
jgi:hypothetical protein